MLSSRTVLSVVAIIGLAAVSAFAVVIETVPVGNPGNAGQWSGYSHGGYGPNRICGSVDYTYNMGKYEVTAGQYTVFLNAVAFTDAYGLYNTSMWSSINGCKIQRSGNSGSYTYSVASDYANRPVNHVSWGDAARFANWLHNGQPTGAQGAGTTETGAYSLNGATTEAQVLAVSRNSNWKWAIPSEDEWYKAAYHKNDGVTGNYWDYPTSSNSVPSNVLGGPADPGNNATYYSNGYTISSPYWCTEVGSHENSASPYGTFDQGGNVWEWNEAVFYDYARGMRGGSFDLSYSGMHASSRSYYYAALEPSIIGFRVVQAPEPASIVICASAGVGMLFRRRGFEW